VLRSGSARAAAASAALTSRARPRSSPRGALAALAAAAVVSAAAASAACGAPDHARCADPQTVSLREGSEAGERAGAPSRGAGRSDGPVAAVAHAASPSGAGARAGEAVGAERAAAAVGGTSRWGAPDVSRIEQLTATQGFRLGRPESLRIPPIGRSVLFLRSGPRDGARALYRADLETGEETLVIQADSMLGSATEALSEAERARRERLRLSARGIVSYALFPQGDRALVPLSGRLFVVEIATGAARELPLPDGPALVDPRLSPDGARVAYVRDGDLYVAEVASGRERRLTRRARPTLTYGEAEFVAQEEMDRMEGYWWSPDGRQLAVEEADVAGVETLHIADPAHPERPPAAFPYPRAGRANAAVRLGLVPVTGGPLRFVDWDRDRYPYLARVVWSEGGLFVLVQDRTQTEEVLLSVDPRTARATPLLTERDEAWLNLDPHMPRPLRDGTFLWTTERDGAWALELRARDGALLRTVVPKEAGYRDLVHLDEARGQIVFEASLDPVEAHLFRAPLDGSAPPERLTHAPGTHTAVYGADGTSVRTSDLQTGERVVRVVRADGSDGPALRSVAERPARLPDVELGWTRTDPPLRYAIVRPHGLRERRAAGERVRVPVIDWAYGGPHARQVQGTPYRYVAAQWLADHGFAVVCIDGRGTPGRGRAFERAIARDLIGLPLRDHAAALRDLGARYPELDTERAGVFGWSFGGYFAAMAALTPGTPYRAAAAGAPVTDWRDYDTHYTERYMGLPGAQEAAYERTSAVAAAGRLDRPLLLVHGTADDNVYFMHTVKLADALHREGKRFEFVPLAGQTHMVTGAVLVRRWNELLARFFAEHLGAPQASP
jgi:dipeptidyl-peptidase-4